MKFIFIKRKNIVILLAIIILLAFLQAGLIFLLRLSNSPTENLLFYLPKILKVEKEKNLLVHYSFSSDNNFFNEAYLAGGKNKKEEKNFVYGGILPHHLLVKDRIASFFLGLEKENYDLIVLIGPNHFLKGRSKIALSEAEWITPYGNLEPDLNFTKKVDEKLKKANIEEDVFKTEHSISGLVGFIKKSFPRAKFSPIVLSADLSAEESEELANTIFSVAGNKKTLVLASVDFSHYQPFLSAEMHDYKSNEVIKSFDYKSVYDLEIDSPPSIYTALKYFDLVGAKSADLIFKTNSSMLGGLFDAPSTSHNFYYFTKGDGSENIRGLNMLFFGDIMLDRHVGEKIKKGGLAGIIGKLAGEEGRFFKGVDIIAANLEGAVTDKGEHYNPSYANDFAFAPDLIMELKDKYNFNFLNLANNHFFDQGERGIIETRKNLDKIGLEYSGSEDRKIDEHSSTIIEKSGTKIGLVGFSMVYGKLDEKKAQEEVEKLNKKTDFIIVNVHWGSEYTHNFSNLQKEFAHLLIDSGADIIIGHHPHVAEGMEIYKNRPIFYSLGNFIFDQYFSSDTQEGLALGLASSKKEIEMFLFPIKSKISEVQLMKNKEKEVFLEKFAKWSNAEEGFKNEILNGRIKILF